MKLSKIYTRTGDKGQTSLIGGHRVDKDNIRIEAYGTIDELSAHLGLLASYITQSPKVSDDGTTQVLADLERIQNALFNLGSYLATDTSKPSPYPAPSLRPEETTFLEQRIDEYNASLPELNSFILPGGDITASQCHVCRTVCRRAERRIISLAHAAGAEFSADAAAYVNRLSDFLFVLARKLNIIYNTTEKTWNFSCQ